MSEIMRDNYFISIISWLFAFSKCKSLSFKNIFVHAVSKNKLN